MPDGPAPERGVLPQLARREAGALAAPSSAPGLQGQNGGPSFQDSGIDWARHLASAQRYKWLILLGGMLGTAAGWFATSGFQPVYVAHATVWVQEDDRNGRQQGPIQSGQLLGNFGWLELLESYAVLEPAVSKLRLYLEVADARHHPLFNDFQLRDEYTTGSYRFSVDSAGVGYTLLTDREALVLEQGALGDSVGRALGFRWRPVPAVLEPGQDVRFTVRTFRDAATRLSQDLIAEKQQRGNFLRLELAGTTPSLIAATVNAVVDEFLRVSTEMKRQKLTELAGILQDQLRRADENLKAAEMELQNFRVATITLPSEPGSPVAAGVETTTDPAISGFFALRVEKEQMLRDRQAIEEALTRVGDAGLSVEDFETIGAVQRSSEASLALQELTQRNADLRTLLYRYTEVHPEVRRVQSEIEQLERVTIPAIVRDVAFQLRDRENQLAATVESASEELQQIPRRSIQEARLAREVVVAENLYTTLQARYEAARLAELSAVPDLRELDRAVAPTRPTTAIGMRFILVGLVGGLVAGLAGALILGLVDRRVRHPEEVTTGLGLPLLGVVPQLKASVGRTAEPVVEAIRGVRLNLLHAHGAAGPVAVAVSSPGPGDGKSFLAANLALSFAHAGYRTVIVDADLRRGALHQVLDGSRKPGLTDHLSGDTPFSDVIQATSQPSLWFVGCGTRTLGGPELLTSAALPEFVQQLRSRFSVIILDTPPLGAGIDAFSLGMVVGSMLLVLRMGITDRQLAAVKLDALDRLPIRLLGAVLNDARKGPASYHQYGYSYYLPGYEMSSEEDEEESKLLVQGS